MNDLALEADVLVVGGGTAGSMAAVKAKEALPGGTVLLLERANVKRSGAIALGMDGVNNASFRDTRPPSSTAGRAPVHIQQLLLEVWSELGVTTLFVSHDVDEALFLSDRVLVLTCRPASIKAEVEVDLPRPRGLETVTGPAFTALKRRCLALLRDDAGALRPMAGRSPRRQLTTP